MYSKNIYFKNICYQNRLLKLNLESSWLRRLNVFQNNVSRPVNASRQTSTTNSNSHLNIYVSQWTCLCCPIQAIQWYTWYLCIYVVPHRQYRATRDILYLCCLIQAIHSCTWYICIYVVSYKQYTGTCDIYVYMLSHTGNTEVHAIFMYIHT